jgi:hypothetical protein
LKLCLATLTFHGPRPPNKNRMISKLHPNDIRTTPK